VQEIDKAIKTSMALTPDCFLDLLFGSKRKIKLKTIADSQITVPELRVDKALLVKEGRQTFYIICEAMIRPKQDELPTFALKGLGMQYMLKRPTLAVIVYLKKGKYASFPDGFENRIGALSNQFTLCKILLWEHETRILSGELKELAPFLSLFHRRPDPGVIKVQAQLIEKISDPKLRADLLAIAIIVDIHVFGERVVFAQLPKEVNMLKESRLIKGWMTESEQTGERKGKLSMLQKQLHQRIGGMSPELLLKLRKLNDTQLDYLSLALFTINSREDLRAWLNNGAAKASRKR